jgi:nitroreductase
MILDIVKKDRSFRRFDEKYIISTDILKDLIELGRLSPSAGNVQPLKYMISHTREQNERIFPYLAWAGYIKDWPGPDEGERPTAYIIILSDTEIAPNCGCDHGIAAQSILLGAAEIGIGACMIGSIDREGLREELKIDSRYKIKLILALGKAAETVVLEDVKDDGSIRYWRDDNGVHHVPKRHLHDIIID